MKISKKQVKRLKQIQHEIIQIRSDMTMIDLDRFNKGLTSDGVFSRTKMIEFYRRLDESMIALGDLMKEIKGQPPREDVCSR